MSGETCLICSSSLSNEDKWKHCKSCKEKAIVGKFYAKTNLKFSFREYTDNVKICGHYGYFSVILPLEYAKHMRCKAPKGLIRLLPEQDAMFESNNLSLCYYCKESYFGNDAIFHYDQCKQVPIYTLNEVEKLRFDLNIGNVRRLNHRELKFHKEQEKISHQQDLKERKNLFNLYGSFGNSSIGTVGPSGITGSSESNPYQKTIPYYPPIKYKEEEIQSYDALDYTCPICGKLSSALHIDKCLELSSVSSFLHEIITNKETNSETRKMTLDNYLITIDPNVSSVLDTLLNLFDKNDSNTNNKNANNNNNNNVISKGKEEILEHDYGSNNDIVFEISEYLIGKLHYSGALGFEHSKILCKHLKKNKIIQKYFQDKFDSFLTKDNHFTIYDNFLRNNYDPDWIKTIIKIKMRKLNSLNELAMILDGQNIKDPSFSLIINMWLKIEKDEKEKSIYDKHYENALLEPYYDEDSYLS